VAVCTACRDVSLDRQAVGVVYCVVSRVPISISTDAFSSQKMHCCFAVPVRAASGVQHICSILYYWMCILQRLAQSDLLEDM
jgi:hypothetical protein